MQIQISGHVNNQPVVTTYDVSEEPIAEAIPDGELWFIVEANLDMELEYALINDEGAFVAMVMFIDDPHRAMQVTFHNGSKTEGTLTVHSVKVIGGQPQ